MSFEKVEIEIKEKLFKRFRQCYYKLIISILMDEPEEIVNHFYQEYRELYFQIYGKELEKDLEYYIQKSEEYMIVITRTGKYKIIRVNSVMKEDYSFPK